ncbi:MAG: class I SAM-dependent methyltransferase [Candidatus Nomurabacteria bacterium]|nr:class I SAM-dependent methyltransferase [Candidatus Nomurabacteria bacterium]
MRFEEKVAGLRIKKHQGRETGEFLEDVKALADGEAYEYLLGEVDFCGAKIDLSLRPMIPRPETEFWIKQVIENIRDGESFFTIRALDLFSGSGNVSLAILKNIPESSVDMIEFDPKLKNQIEISILKNNIKKTRTRILTGDTWEGAVGMYDVITAVPPYVPPQMKDEVMQELHAEAPLSFFDKEDGYYYHKQVLSKAKDFLKEKGILYLEFDITQREKIEELAKEFGWTNYSFLKDQYGHEFVIMLVK